MSALIVFIQKAIAQGIGMLFGATGEIITEKSGNLNLGVPGLMYMGGIAGLMGALSMKAEQRIQAALWVCLFPCCVPCWLPVLVH